MAFYLTGHFGLDYSNASSTLLLDIRRRDWSHEMCAHFGLDVALLPPVLLVFVLNRFIVRGLVEGMMY